MPTPTIQMEVIADFLIKSGKIDDSKLVEQIKKSVKSLKIPRLSVDTLLDLGDSKKAVAALADLQTGIARVDEAQGALPKSLQKYYDKLNETPEGREQRKKLIPVEEDFTRIFGEQVAGISKQYDSIRTTLEKAKALSETRFSSSAGRSLEEANRILDAVIAGERAFESLSKQEKKAAREALDFRKDQAKLIKQFKNESLKLERTAFQPVKDEFGEVKGFEKVPLAPVSLSGVDESLRSLDDKNAKGEKALKDNFISGVKAQVDAATEAVKGPLRKALDDTKKQLKDLKLPKDIVSGFQGELKTAQDTIEEIRKDRKALNQIKKGDDFAEQDRLSKSILQRSVKAEKSLSDIRMGIEKQVSEQRSIELGRYINKAAKLSRSVVAEQQRQIGASLLKGADREDQAIRKLKRPEDADSVIGELENRVKGAANALVEYTNTADQASLAQDRNFLGLQRRLYEETRLLDSAKQKRAALRNVGTPAGDRQDKSLESSTQKQIKLLDQLIEKNREVRESVKGSKLQETDKREVLGELDLRSQQARTLQSDILTGTSEVDLRERSSALSLAKSQATDLIRENKKVVTSYEKLAKSAQKLYEVAPQRVSSERGEQIIERRGISEDAIRSLKTYTEVNDLLNGVEQRTRRTTEEQSRYADALERGDKLAQQGYDQATRRLEQLDRASTIATAELKKFGLDDNKVISQAERVRASLSGLGKGADNLVGSLDKVSSSLPTDRVDALTDRTDRLRKSLSNVEKEFRSAFQQNSADPRALSEAVERAQQTIAAARAEYSALQRDTAAAKSEGVAQQRLAQERQAQAEIERGQQQIVAAGQGRGVSTLDPTRAPVGAIAAAVSQVGVTDLLRQKELQVAIGQQLKSIENDRNAVLADTVRLGKDEAEARAKVLDNEYSLVKAEGDRLRQKESEYKRESARKARQEATEERRKSGELSDAQHRYAKQEYGIDLDQARAINVGLDDLRRANVSRRSEIRADLAQMRDTLGEGPAKATEAYKKLNAEMKTLARQQKDLTRLGKEVNRELKAIGSATSPEQIAKLQVARREIADRIINNAGGAGSLANSLRGVPKEDLGQLPNVRDELKRRLATRQAELASIVAEGGDRQGEGYKKAAKEAYQLEKAIDRVNTRLRGYYTLTAQAGALARQFARYGLGYAALYQALFGVRQLIAGVVDLDSALISIQAVTQSTNKEMALIEKSIKRVALATQFSTSEIAQASQVLAQAGVEAQEFPKALTAVAAFASATESSIVVASDLISSLRNVFKEMEDLQIANQLTQAVNISKLTAEDLKTIISLSAQMAGTFGLASEQYLSAVTTLRNAGIKASTVATGLRQALIEIFSPDSKTLKVLLKRSEQLGEQTTGGELRQRFFSFSQESDPLEAVLRELKRLGFGGAGKAVFSGRTFDVRAENAINGLINNLDEYVQGQAQVVFGNAAITASVTQMESLAASAKNLGAALTTASYDLTQDLLPKIEDLIDGLTEAVQGLSEFDSRLRRDTGANIGDILLAGIVGSAIASRRVPQNLGPLKTAGFVAGTGVAAATASGVAADLVPEGTSGGLSKLASDGAGLVATALIVFSKDLVDALKAAAKFVLPKSIKNILKGMVEGAEDLGKEVKTASKARFGFVGKVFSKLFSVFRIGGGPIGLLLSLAGIAGAISAYWDRWKTDAKDAENKFKEATERAASARADFDLFTQQEAQFRGSDTGQGYTAPEGTLASAAEKLSGDIEEYSNAMVNLFGLSGDLSEEKAREITRALQDIERYGAEEGETRERFTENLENISDVNFRATPQRRAVLRDLVTLRSDVDNKSKGLFESSRQLYARGVELGDGESDNINDLAAREFRKAVDNAGFRQEILGFADASAEEISALLGEFVRTFKDSSDYLKLKNKQIGKLSQENNRKLETELDRLTKDFSNYQDRLVAALEGISIPETAEDYKQLRQRRGSIQQKREELEEKSKPEPFVQPKGLGGLLSAVAGNALDIITFQKTESELRAEYRERFESLKALEDATTQAGQTFQARLKDDELTEEARINAIVTQLREVDELRQEGNPRAIEDFKLLEAGLNLGETAPGEIKAILQLGRTGEGNEDLSPIEAYKRLINPNVLPGKVSEPTVRSDFNEGIVRVEGEKFLGALELRADQMLTAAIQTEKSIENLSFEQTAEYQTGRRNIFDLNQGVRDSRFNRKFDDAQGFLDQRRAAQARLLDAEERFVKEKGKGEDDPTGAKYQDKLNKIYEERFRIEAAYNEERRSIVEQDFKYSSEKLKKQLEGLKEVAERAASDPTFEDFASLNETDEKFRKAVDSYVALIEEFGARTGDPEAAQDLIDAAHAKYGESIYEYAQTWQNARDATAAYLSSLPKVLDAFFLTERPTIERAIFDADRGRVPDRADRLLSNREQFVRAKSTLPSQFSQRDEIEAQLRAEESKDTDGNPETAADPKVLNELNQQLGEVQAQIRSTINDLANLEDEARGLNFDIFGEIREGFDASALFDDLEIATAASVQGISDTIRESFLNAFDGVSDIIVDAAFGDLDKSFLSTLDDLIREVFDSIAKSILKAAIQTAITQSIGGIFGGSAGDAGFLGGFLSLLGGGSSSAATGGTISSGTVDNSMTGSTIRGGRAIAPSAGRLPAPLRRAQGGMVSSSVSASSGSGLLSAALGDVPAPLRRAQGGMVSSSVSASSGSGLLSAALGGVPAPLRRAQGGMVTSGESGAGSLLDKLVGGGEDSGAQRTNSQSEHREKVLLIREALGEEGVDKPVKRNMGGMIPPVRRAGGGAVYHTSLGEAINRSHGGMIKGPGTGTSDSIPGVIVDEAGRPQRGILVSNGEAILNAKATARLGKDTIDFLNTNADKFASGGVVGASRSVQKTIHSISQTTSKTVKPTAEQSETMSGVASALSGLSNQLRTPQDMRLEVSDGALNRTLREYVEDYLADVVARR